MESKVCLKCHQSKPIEDYYTTRWGGRINECKACKIEYHRAYREKNKEYLKLQKIDKALSLKHKPVKVEKFKPRKCAKRDCSEPAVQVESVVKFCKSHAHDYIFSIEDV